MHPSRMSGYSAFSNRKSILPRSGPFLMIDLIAGQVFMEGQQHIPCPPPESQLSVNINTSVCDISHKKHVTCVA